MGERQIKILHIDDDEHVLAATRHVLEYAGYTVTSSTGPFIGHLIESEHPDLLVMDLEMPFISGEKMVGIVKSRPEYGDLPVVFFSGKPAERIRTLVDAERKVFYVSKEAGVQRLIEVIREVVGG